MPKSVVPNLSRLSNVGLTPATRNNGICSRRSVRLGPRVPTNPSSPRPRSQPAERSNRERKRQPVPNYDASKYQVERIFATAKDGVRVPIALVHKKGVPREAKLPLAPLVRRIEGVAREADVSIEEVLTSRRMRKMYESACRAVER